MVFKKSIIMILFFTGISSVYAESFVEEPCKKTTKKLSARQKKEKVADDLKELARSITKEMKQLLETQELIIDRLDELVNNDTKGVFSGKSDSALEKIVIEVESLRDESTKRCNCHKKHNYFLQHGF